MTHYVVELELAAHLTDDVTGWIVETLQPWHAVAVGCPSGNVGVIMTLPAEDLSQAAVTAYRLVEPTYSIVQLCVVDEVTRDRREGFTD